MKEVFQAVLVFLCGAGGLAIINVVQERWRWRAERKAHKEDRAEDKAEEQERINHEREDMLSEINKNLNDYIQRQDGFNAEFVSRVVELENQNSAQSEGMKYVLLDRILHLGHKYILAGEVSFDDRKRLGDMHTVYHKRLGGNGDAEAIMDGVYALPLKK